MKTRYILLYAAAFLVLSALICGRILGMDQAGELPQYTTEINRLLVKLSENWEELPGAQLPEEDFDYTLIGSDGELIFATMTFNSDIKVYFLYWKFINIKLNFVIKTWKNPDECFNKRF